MDIYDKTYKLISEGFFSSFFGYENEGILKLFDDDGEFAEIQIKNISPDAFVHIMTFFDFSLILETSRIIEYKEIIENKVSNINLNGFWSKFSNIQVSYDNNKKLFNIFGDAIDNRDNKVKLNFEINVTSSGLSNYSNNVKIIIKR